MATFTEIMYRTLRVFWTPLLVLLVLVLFIWAGSWVFQSTVSKMLKNTPFNDVANSAETDKTATVSFYYATWCPACKRAKPEWEAFKEEYDGTKEVNGYTVVCADVDCTDSDDPQVTAIVQENDIQHFPTILMTVHGNTITFDSPVSKSALDLFVQKMLV